VEGQELESALKNSQVDAALSTVSVPSIRTDKKSSVVGSMNKSLKNNFKVLDEIIDQSQRKMNERKEK